MCWDRRFMWHYMEHGRKDSGILMCFSTGEN